MDDTDGRHPCPSLYTVQGIQGTTCERRGRCIRRKPCAAKRPFYVHQVVSKIVAVSPRNDLTTRNLLGASCCGCICCCCCCCCRRCPCLGLYPGREHLLCSSADIFPTSFALLFSTKRENCPTLCRKFVPEMGNSTAIVKWNRPINVPKPT